MTEYDVEAMGEAVGRCACCGAVSRSIWGVVHLVGAETVASYFATWTPGAVLAAHPVNMDVILGAWGEGTGAADRVGVSLLYAEAGGGPALTVIDAKSGKLAKNPLVGAALGRDEVMDTPVAGTVFGIFDAVVAQDARFEI